MSTVRQLSFSSGEISQSLGARVDLVKYSTGLKTARNCYVQRHGGLANRPGTEFICEVKDSSAGAIRLIPFIFNATQTYMLEFGHLYMRVIRNGAQITDADMTITAITNANPCVVTYSGADPTGFANDDEVYITGITGAIGTYLNNRNFRAVSVNTGANTFALQYLDGTDVNSTSFGSYTSGGTASRIYEITSSYAEDDLPDLKFVQSGDIIYLAHPSHPPRTLSRTGHTSWSFDNITFEPGIDAPTSLAGGSAGSTIHYQVTAIASETFEESLPSNTLGTTAAASNLTWSSVSGAVEYSVYKSTQGSSGPFGFIGTAVSTGFNDTGITADLTASPPSARNPFGSTDNYPSTVAFFQQRLIYGNTNNDPEKIWTSRTGQFTNFTTSSPLQNDDAITFTLAGRQVNSVQHILDLGRLLSLTTGGEWAIQGDGAGVLTPTDINAKQYSYNGSYTLSPLIVNENALYIQARGTVIRDLGFDYQVDGYRGNDLTIFASHLFDKYSINDWTYQQIPNSIVWAARSDGTLLGLTYIREHQVFGWHHHDFDGVVENVAVIPEGNEDFLYLSINRTIDGASKRYIERFSTRLIDDVIDNKFMDSHLSYDGRHTGSTTMTLSGSGWTFTDTITLTASSGFFVSTDVGNQIQLTGSDGDMIRFTIDAYTSSTVVTGRPHKTVPVSMRATAITTWAKAVDQLTGLWHLEGEEVSVFGDRFVVASPNNDSYDVVTVTNGTITLDKPYAVIHVGLPYITDIQTLNIDTPQGETIIDKKKLVTRVTAYLEDSRGLFVGAKPPTDDDTDPLEGLSELKIRNDEGMDDAVDLVTDAVEINIQPEWNSNGRIFMRQIDPIPLTVLAVAPSGSFPFRGGNNG